MSETNHDTNEAKARERELLHWSKAVWEWNGRGLARTLFEKCPEAGTCPAADTPNCPYFEEILE